METDLRKAGIKAGIKLATGLVVLTAIVGIRIVTATPEGVAAGIEELEQLEAELGSREELEERGAEMDERERSGDPGSDSVLSGIGDRVRSQLGVGSSDGPDAERLVSCSLDGSVQFMRAADCLSRGGSSKDVKPRSPRS